MTIRMTPAKVWYECDGCGRKQAPVFSEVRTGVQPTPPKGWVKKQVRKNGITKERVYCPQCVEA